MCSIHEKLSKQTNPRYFISASNGSSKLFIKIRGVVSKYLWLGKNIYFFRLDWNENGYYLDIDKDYLILNLFVANNSELFLYF